jgi:hypothetical protein
VTFYVDYNIIVIFVTIVKNQTTFYTFFVANGYYSRLKVLKNLNRLGREL